MSIPTHSQLRRARIFSYNHNDGRYNYTAILSTAKRRTLYEPEFWVTCTDTGDVFKVYLTYDDILRKESGQPVLPENVQVHEVVSREDYLLGSILGGANIFTAGYKVIGARLQERNLFIRNEYDLKWYRYYPPHYQKAYAIDIEGIDLTTVVPHVPQERK